MEVASDASGEAVTRDRQVRDGQFQMLPAVAVDGHVLPGGDVTRNGARSASAGTKSSWPSSPTLRASHQRDHGDQGHVPYATIPHLPSPFIRATDGRPLYRAE